MANELEKLLISLDADTRKLRLAMAQGEAIVGKFEKTVDRSLGKSESHFTRFSSKISGTLTALGSAIAGLFAAQQLQQSIIDVAELERAAVLAGLTADQLQKLQAAARGAGVGASTMNDAMKELATKIGEVKTRSGGYYEFLRSHLPTVEAQIRGSRSTAEAMNIVAETVRRLGSAEERAMFIKQSLGEAGLQLTSTLLKGSAGLKDAGDEAAKYGQVLSAEAITNTVALNKELGDLSETLSTKFKEGLGGVAPYITSAIKGIREAISDTNKDRGGSFSLGDMASGLMQPATQSGEKVATAFLEGWTATIAREAPKNDALKMLVKMPDFSTEIDFSGADALAEMRIKSLQAAGETTDLIKAEYDRDVENFRRMLADKKIDEADFQAAREQLSIQAGEKIAAAYAKETEAVRRLGQQFSGVMESAFGDAFSTLLETGKMNFKQFAASLMADIAKIYVQSQLIKPLMGALGGALGGAIGGAGGIGGWETAVSSFGGFRAAGGPVSAGKSYMVGERGPEMFTPGASGNISSNKSMGGSVYNIDARNAEIGVEERIRAVLGQVERERQSPVAAVSQYQRRFPTRRAA